MYIFSYYFSSDRDFIGEQEHIKEKQEECGHKIQESRYKKSEIDRRTKQKLSIMPAGLEQTMSTEDLVDLVEYLSSLKKRAQ